MSKILKKLGNHSFVTKLAGFEHSKYFQFNATHEVNDIPCVQGKNIKNGRVSDDFDWYISKEISEALPRSVLNKKCIVVPYVGSKLGELAIFDKKFICHLASNVAKIELTDDVFNLDYLYYYLKGPYGQNQLFRDKQGSTQPNITMKSIRETKVMYFDKFYQQKIAYTLSTLDLKIELNNKINAELEQMAKTLYDYWFVQFDFPNENSKPYKSSRGKMVFNEKLKSDIPAEWEVKKISDLFTFQKGVEPGASEYKNNRESADHILFYRVGDIDGSSNTYVDSKAKNYNLVEETDVIITFDGSVGKMGFGLNGAYSGGLQKIYDHTGKFDNSLVYALFRDERIIKTIHQYATGSIILHASGAIKHLSVPFNETKYLDFQKIIKPIFTKLIKNKSENQKLAELRDWLLPMLMNGQVEVM